MKILKFILFFTFILLLPSQLGKHWWPEWSLVNGVRVDYLSPTIYLSDILLFLLLISIFINHILSLRGALATRQPPRLPRSLRSLAMTGAFYVLFIILRTPRPWLAFYWLARYLEIGAVAWVTIKIENREQRTENREGIWSALVAAALFTVGLGGIQMILGGTTGWFWWLGERTFMAATPGVATLTIFGREILRPYATFPHPNALGGFLAAAIMMEYGVWSMEYGIWNKKNIIWRKLVLLIGIIGVGLTGSRAAILGLIIAKLLNCYIVSEIRRVKNWGLLGIVIVSSLVIGYRWNNTNKLVIFANESSTERNILNHAAIKMWQDNWLTGVGPGQFLAKLPDYLPGGFYKIQPAHNVFLLGLAEFGIIGLSIIIITIIKVIKSAVGGGGAGLKWLPVLTVIFVTGMVDHYWLTAQQNRLLLGVILGLMISAWGRRSIGDSGLRPRNR